MSGERMEAAREAWLALEVEQRAALRILVDVYLIDQVMAWDNETGKLESQVTDALSVAGRSGGPVPLP